MINLEQLLESEEIQVKYSIYRVTQDNNLDGSISVTLHMEKRGTSPDGSSVRMGPLEAFSATYPSVEAMVQAAAATWAPSQEYRESLAERIQDNPLEASEAVLESYVGILNAMQSYLASQQATQSAE
jgi:hypothetical protein